jgi:hypothetical protein
LNDARHQLITRDNFIKDLQQQLADPAFRKTTANELKVCFYSKKIISHKPSYFIYFLGLEFFKQYVQQVDFNK